LFRNEIVSLFTEKVPAILPVLKTGLILNRDEDLTQLRSAMRSKKFDEVNSLWSHLNLSFPVDVYWNVEACLVFKKVVLAIAILDSRQTTYIDKAVLKEFKVKVYENINTALKD